jgi:hypothetical protein
VVVKGASVGESEARVNVSPEKGASRDNHHRLLLLGVVVVVSSIVGFGDHGCGGTRGKGSSLHHRTDFGDADPCKRKRKCLSALSGLRSFPFPFLGTIGHSNRGILQGNNNRPGRCAKQRRAHEAQVG